MNKILILRFYRALIIQSDKKYDQKLKEKNIMCGIFFKKKMTGSEKLTHVFEKRLTVFVKNTFGVFET